MASTETFSVIFLKGRLEPFYLHTWAENAACPEPSRTSYLTDATSYNQQSYALPGHPEGNKWFSYIMPKLMKRYHKNVIQIWVGVLIYINTKMSIISD